MRCLRAPSTGRPRVLHALTGAENRKLIVLHFFSSDRAVRPAHAIRTSPKIVDHHMPTHDIRRADVEHRWTRARSSSSHAGHDYRLHHSGDGFECVRFFDASWPLLTAGKSPRTARHKLEPIAVLHLLRAPQGSPRQRPMLQEPAPPASCAPAGPRQGVSDPSPNAPARSAWERA